MNGKKWLLVSGRAVVVVVVCLAVIGSIVYLVLATALPAERPDQFSFEISKGMEGYKSMSYYLHNGHMVYTNNVGPNVTVEFDLTTEELDYIWQLLRVERFDRILQQSQGGIHGSGTTLWLTYDDETISVINEQNYFVGGDSAKRFYAIEKAIIDLVQPYLDARQQAITIQVNADLLPKLQSIALNVSMNSEMLYDSTATEPITELPAHLSLLPGDYAIYITTPPTQLGSFRVSPGSQVFPLTVTNSASILISGSPDAITITQQPILE